MSLRLPASQLFLKCQWTPKIVTPASLVDSTETEQQVIHRCEQCRRVCMIYDAHGCIQKLHNFFLIHDMCICEACRNRRK